MQKEKKTAHEIAAEIEERIGRRAVISVMRDHPINGWYARVVAPGNPKLLELQDEVDKISDALRDRYELKNSES
jgi:MOSC domain-containing protein YiiM